MASSTPPTTSGGDEADPQFHAAQVWFALQLVQFYTGYSVEATNRAPMAVMLRTTHETTATID